jgi:molybdate transport system ATP-binding protein
VVEHAGLVVRLEQARPISLDVDFICAPGELLALVGPSGSGKTTILRAIAGLYRPRRGEVQVTGTVWLDTKGGVDLSPRSRRVGFVFQDYALFPHMSALANVAAALGHLPRRERHGRARALLELVHLAGLEDRRPHELSGGQRQRVAVARALARDPAVLLLDEPFSAVDQVTRRRLQRELVLLRRSIGIPMILVTHDLGEAAALADRLCVLHQGTTLQTGSPQEVLNRPASPLVARLVDLGNVFDGEVVEHRPEQGFTILRWLGMRLEARHTPGFDAGESVAWVIPPAFIVMHRRDRPSKGERENAVRGRVSELVTLGETTSVQMRLEVDPATTLHFTISTHAARRNGLAPDVPLTVSLLAEGIHLMPPEPGE